MRETWTLQRLAVATAWFVIGLLPVAYAQAPAAKGPPPALVEVAVAQRVTMAPVVWLPGTVVSRHDARVAAEVEGRLVSVAEVGQRVASGQRLASIDDTRLLLEQAEARAVVVRERARLAYAEQELKRAQQLAAKGLVTTSRLDEARSARDAARAEQGAVAARLDRVDDLLRRTTIKAPFAGIVTERLRRPGERVEEGDTVVRLVDPDTVEVQVRVTPDNLPHLSAHKEIELKVGTSSSNGVVRTVVPVGDDVSRLYDVRLTVPAGTWPAGTTVRVAAPTAVPREVVAVPRDALVLRRSGTSVFRVSDNGQAEQVPVQLGVASGSLIEVNGDIRVGDRVVVRGGERLRAGQPVKVTDS